MRKVVGMDLGDKSHVVCVVDEQGEVIERVNLPNTSSGLQKFFGKSDAMLVAMEVGTHSPWISRLLESLGHQVLVGNARKLRAIWDSDQKDDTTDAEMIARIARFDPKLLYPIHHRSEQAQQDLALIRSRHEVMKTRRSLINHARGLVKSFGYRLPKCSTHSFAGKAAEHLPEILEDALGPVLELIGNLSEQIRGYDKSIERLCETRYPETAWLMQVPGVGPLTALAYVLTLEEPGRFDRSRAVGPFLGLVPRRDQSGETDKQLRITKAGDSYLRQLLVGSAHYILGPFGTDTDLRRHGLRIAARGGKNAKKRAAVAVARKLAVLLHALWRDRSEYQPLLLEDREAA